MPQTAALPSIQVVFQGGGARFASLLAVAEALQDLERDGKVVVTRAAGASAGALVAAMYGKRVSASHVRTTLMAKYGDAFFAKAFPERSLVGHLPSLLRGRALYDINRLKPLLLEFFEPAETLASLKIPTHVSVTSLDLGRKKVLSGESVVVEALLHSASIPFVFANVKEVSKGFPYVDGGVCENLPSAELFPFANKDGPVFGISFAKTPPKAIEGTFSFVNNLIEIVVENAVERSIREIGEHRVHRVASPLGTLDFQKVCSVGLSQGEYSRVKNEATSWFIQRFAHMSGGSASDPLPETTRAEERLEDLKGRINQTYLQYIKRSTATVTRSALCVVCSSLIPGHSQTDDVYHVAEIQTGSSELQMYKVGIISTHSLSQSFVVRDLNNRSAPPRNYLALPCTDDRYPTARAVVLWFDPPLPPNSTFEVRRVEAIPGALEGLAKTPRQAERVSNRNSRGQSVPMMDLIVVLPQAMTFRVEPDDREVAVAFAPLLDHELSAHYDFVGRPAMKSHGWRAKDVPAPGYFGIKLYA